MARPPNRNRLKVSVESHPTCPVSALRLPYGWWRSLAETRHQSFDMSRAAGGDLSRGPRVETEQRPAHSGRWRRSLHVQSLTTSITGRQPAGAVGSGSVWLVAGRWLAGLANGY